MKKSVSVFLAVLTALCLCSCTRSVNENESIGEYFENTSLSQMHYESEPTTQATTVAAVVTKETATQTTAPDTQTAEVVTAAQTTQSTTAEMKTTLPKKETTTEKATSEKVTQSESTADVNAVTCYVEISCKLILDNESKLKENKKPFVTKSGMILERTQTMLEEGSTAFDALKKTCEENVCTDNCRFCQKNGIQLDYVYTPGYDSNYVRGIHQLYEKDCGSKSGWVYLINGEFKALGSNKYNIKNGDVIQFIYSCDLGDDIY